jgi:mRNA interferase YafQ
VPELLTIKPTNVFLRDLKRCQKRHKNIDKLEAIINLLQAGNPLPTKNRDHILTGNWKDHRECHIQPDWLLIYRVKEEFLFLERTGSHSDLF